MQTNYSIFFQPTTITLYPYIFLCCYQQTFLYQAMEEYKAIWCNKNVVFPTSFNSRAIFKQQNCLEVYTAWRKIWLAENFMKWQSLILSYWKNKAFCFRIVQRKMLHNNAQHTTGYCSVTCLIFIAADVNYFDDNQCTRTRCWETLKKSTSHYNGNRLAIHGPCRRFRGDQNDEDTRTFCGNFLYNAIASTNNATAQHKNCPSSGIDDRPGRDLFRVLKSSPISQSHTLGLSSDF